MKPHFHGHQENLRPAALSIFPLRKTLFQGLLWKIQGLFKDMPIFKDILRT